jgi:acetyltransferase-like isoleucine patch superfamily enzyme
MEIINLFNRAGMKIASQSRNYLYRAMGVDIRGYSWLRRIEVPRNWSDITLICCALDNGVTLLSSGPVKKDKIKIGTGTYINRNTILDASNKLWIGSRVMIGPMCFITDSEHTIKVHSDVGSQPMEVGETIIDDGAWLGAGVVVLRNVRIGKFAVVGAGSVVTKDVPDNEIHAGVPARKIGAQGDLSI